MKWIGVFSLLLAACSGDSASDSAAAGAPAVYNGGSGGTVATGGSGGSNGASIERNPCAPTFGEGRLHYMRTTGDCPVIVDAILMFGSQQGAVPVGQGIQITSAQTKGCVTTVAGTVHQTSSAGTVDLSVNVSMDYTPAQEHQTDLYATGEYKVQGSASDGTSCSATYAITVTPTDISTGTKK